jgi:hypothetical protein
LYELLTGRGDSQPEHPPALDDSLIGTQLEVCWRYWRPPTEEEKGQGEKRKKIAVPIWCEWVRKKSRQGER